MVAIPELREWYGLHRCPVRPYDHQVIGIDALVKRPFFLLADEMGAGKTIQTIVAAQLLFEAGTIDRLLVIAPAGVRAVWFDQEMGELRRHLFVPARITEFHARLRQWTVQPTTTPSDRVLDIYITNYDFIRAKARLHQLLPFCSPKTMLVLDESSAVKNAQAQQTKAVLQLRRACGRVVLLNGTPIANHPGDMYSQGNIMSSRILNCPSYTQFCHRFASMKPILGPGGRPVVSPRTGRPIFAPDSWTGIEVIQKSFGPYVLRRLKKDCLDLPDKLSPVIWTVPLDDRTWKVYKAMRDDLVAWISDASMSMAPQIITKIMRLAQITSGFLGGIETLSLDDGAENPVLDIDAPPTETAVQEVGREKLDLLLERLDAFLGEDPNLKVVIWSRFTPELQRAVSEARARWPSIPMGVVAGGQKKVDREEALRLLHPDTAPAGPAFIFGNPQSGGLGVNFTAADKMIYISRDYSLYRRLQADDRIHRPGQRRPAGYFDILATGPRGQKTVDHDIYTALVVKENLAERTTSAWVKSLRTE